MEKKVAEKPAPTAPAAAPAEPAKAEEKAAKRPRDVFPTPFLKTFSLEFDSHFQSGVTALISLLFQPEEQIPLGR